MKKTLLFSALCAAFVMTGCAKKQEPLVAKVETKTNKSASEVNKTIKRTNVTINSYTDCHTFKASDYKTIPYE